jgi:hypothetical protein
MEDIETNREMEGTETTMNATNKKIRQKAKIWTVTRSFRATDTLSAMIDELAARARMHPGDFIKNAVIERVTFYQKYPDKLEVTP